MLNLIKFPTPWVRWVHSQMARVWWLEVLELGGGGGGGIFKVEIEQNQSNWSYQLGFGAAFSG